MTLYALAAVVIGALAAILGIKWRASSQIKKADDATRAAEKKAGESNVIATEARAEAVGHAEKVTQANDATDAIDRARIEAERRARILEEHANVPKIDPADPRPGAARLRQVPASAEAVPGVHRQANEGDRGPVK